MSSGTGRGHPAASRHSAQQQVIAPHDDLDPTRQLNCASGSSPNSKLCRAVSSPAIHHHARTRRERGGTRTTPAVAAALDAQAQQRFAALKAWRSEVAKAHNLPAYVIFHDATLAAIAALDPRDLRALEGVSGIGAKKLETYGPGVMDVLQALV